MDALGSKHNPSHYRSLTPKDDEGSSDVDQYDAEQSVPVPDKQCCSCCGCKSCHWHSRWCYFCRKFAGLTPKKKVYVFVGFFVFCLVIFFTLVPEGCIHLSDYIAPEELPDPTYLGGPLTAADKMRKHFLVQFHGDSLMTDPDWPQFHKPYNFMNNIKAHLKSYNFTINQRASIAKQMAYVVYSVEDAKVEKPDGLIIYGGYDVANIWFDDISPDEVIRLRSEYIRNLRHIVNTTLSEGKHIAIASVGSILTEGPLFAPSTCRFQRSKQYYSLEYRAVVQAIAAEFDIPFIDFREPFQADIYPWHLCYKGCVTRDGEHANYHGSRIMAKIYAEVMQKWFYQDLLALKEKEQRGGNRDRDREL